MKTKRLMIVDALNAYYRAYIVDPSLSSNGDPIGGVKGFLKILQKLMREIQPDQVIICWDGAGGSKKRKSINKNYKEGRSPIRLNREIRNLTENQELLNKVWQQTRLVEYLNQMPLIQLMFENVEADDLVAYLLQLGYFDGWQKVVVSSDKDFIQVLDSETLLYRPTQKEILNTGRVIDKYGIHPNNFALARAIAGDKNDNLDGVRGVGLTTIKNRFPFLGEEHCYNIKDILSHCKKNVDKFKAYERIAESKDLIRQNYKLMQLSAPNISATSKRKTVKTIENCEFSFNKTEVLKMMNADGFGDTSWTTMFQIFKRIVVDNKN